MNSYHSIRNVFKRDPSTNQVIWGAWSTHEFDQLAETDWELTEKVDGMNIRVTWDGRNISYAGRTDRAEIPGPLAARLRDTFEPIAKPWIEAQFGDRTVTFYGEGYGGKIQKGSAKYGVDQKFILFDIAASRDSALPGEPAPTPVWLERADVYAIAERLGIQRVPLVAFGSLFDAVNYVTEGFASQLGSGPPEGLVARPVAGLLDRRGNRIIAKIRAADFLPSDPEKEGPKS